MNYHQNASYWAEAGVVAVFCAAVSRFSVS
jgi:hypothetical protein